MGSFEQRLGGRRTVVEHGARVLVVEDDPVRTALEVALREEGYEVHGCAEAAVAQQLVDQFPPDLAILGISVIAGPDPYSAVRLLRATSNLPLIMLAAADSVPERLATSDTVADDYLVKPVSIVELLARVQAVLPRTKSAESAVRRIADVTIDESARTVLRAGTRVDLTRTEYDLFAVLAKHPGQALSKVQLLTQTWGFNAYDVNLVEVHMSSLRRKLETHGPRLIHTVRGVGYLLRP